MSLNGLDDAKVAEAYQGALAEAGGWFLLKYASRDAIEIFTRGTGGAAEARGAVAQYEEKSPLYGFLLYRRRKVIIKYVPDGTSRLLQARVAVHFTAVTEKFTPHDTTISITSADELSDAALISACSLHTAAPSSCSSSGSSRRHKLDEITEDAEEGQGTTDDAAAGVRPLTSASSIPTIVEPTAVDSQTQTASQEVPTPAELPESSSSLNTMTPAEESKQLPSQQHAEESKEEKSKFDASDYRASLKDYDALFENGPDPRMSSQTARPTYSEMYDAFYAQYSKPKVKLGPRPRPSVDTTRPHTSGNGAQSTSRPKSSLPAGLRVANRKTMEPKRPKSRDTSVVPSIAFPPPPPIPSVPDLPLGSPTHPPKSPASVKSMPIPSYNLSQKAPSVTPEKQRLMKALQLRKKQMKARKEKITKEVEAAADETTTSAEDLAKGDEPSAVENSFDQPATEEVRSVARRDNEAAVEQHKNDELASSNNASARGGIKPSNSQQDTGVEIMASQTETDDQQSAASASSPTSAQTQGSSCAPSTRPSSIWEDDSHTAEQILKPQDAESQHSEKPPESSPKEDEEESIESSPTVVPEIDSPPPAPHVVVSSQEPDTEAKTSTSDGQFSRRNKRESMVFMSAPKLDDAQPHKSKRQSTIFLPVNENIQEDDASSRRAKRESMVLSASKELGHGEVKEKRRAMFDAVNVHLSAENSEAEYLSDDSFMEELQSAKLEEAKPVSVSKSPIAAVFPRKSSISEVTIPERSSSQQFVPGRLSPDRTPGRKSPGSWLPHTNSDTVVVAKKINVSSGISQRIKALAEKSNRDSTGSVSPLATPDASSSIVAQRKSSFFSTSPGGNSPNGHSIKRLSRASFASLSNTTTPDRNFVLQPTPTERTAYNVQSSPKKPESVQVTARIVRDARTQKPTLTMPNENTPLELHQSPITIDHTKSTQPTPISRSPTKMEPTSPRPPSSSHSKDQSSSVLPRSSSESSWRSFGRRLSESRPAPRSHSAHSFESTDEKKKEEKDKKDSKTSKFFKRMSSISSISRKSSSISSMVPEEEHQSTSLPSLREPPPGVQVGDLNVQFPDTLLWKRRWVEIDSTGNLVLSLSRANEQSKGITRRFHLSEFHMPYAPDQDRQELPNSVVLDFIDGRTLQCACETHMAQAQVLQILREAHDAWLAYGQLS